MAADNRGNRHSPPNPSSAVPEFVGTSEHTHQSPEVHDAIHEDRSDDGEDREARFRAEARRQNDAGEGEVPE